MNNTNNKIFIKETHSSANKGNAVSKCSDGFYRLEAVFTEFPSEYNGGNSFRNVNNRIYDQSNYLPFIENAKQRIASGKTLYGELGHRKSTTINGEKISHIIEDMWYDDKRKAVMGKIKILDTPKGKIVQSLLEGGGSIAISSRCTGDVAPDGKANIQSFVTYDIVINPGFDSAYMKVITEGVDDGVDTMSDFLRSKELNNMKEGIFVLEGEEVKDIVPPINTNETSEIDIVSAIQKYSEYVSQQVDTIEARLNKVNEVLNSQNEVITSLKEVVNGISGEGKTSSTDAEPIDTDDTKETKETPEEPKEEEKEKETKSSDKKESKKDDEEKSKPSGLDNIIGGDEKEEKEVNESYISSGDVYTIQRVLTESVEDIIRTNMINEERKEEKEVNESYISSGDVYTIQQVLTESVEDIIRTNMINEEHKEVNESYISSGDVYTIQQVLTESVENIIETNMINEERKDASPSLRRLYNDIKNSKKRGMVSEEKESKFQKALKNRNENIISESLDYTPGQFDFIKKALMKRIRTKNNDVLAESEIYNPNQFGHIKDAFAKNIQKGGLPVPDEDVEIIEESLRGVANNLVIEAEDAIIIKEALSSYVNECVDQNQETLRLIEFISENKTGDLYKAILDNPSYSFRNPATFLVESKEEDNFTKITNAINNNANLDYYSNLGNVLSTKYRSMSDIASVAYEPSEFISEEFEEGDEKNILIVKNIPEDWKEQWNNMEQEQREDLMRDALEYNIVDDYDAEMFWSTKQDVFTVGVDPLDPEYVVEAMKRMNQYR